MATRFFARSFAVYLPDTPILVTRFYDEKGGGVEITDFCPRFENGGDGGLFCPKLLVRQVSPIGSSPNIRVRINPAAEYGCTKRPHTLGASHISYAGEPRLRLTTDAPID